MKPTLVTTRSFVCPHCNNRKFEYEHLYQQGVPGDWTWNCYNCGCYISFTMNKEFEIDVTNVKIAKYPKVLVLLQLDPDDGARLEKPLYLVIETINYRHEEDLVEFCKYQEYYYNERTCPSNYLGDTTVLYGGDDDPHGIFKFVEAIWMPEGFNTCDFHNNGGDYSTLFAALKNGN